MKLPFCRACIIFLAILSFETFNLLQAAGPLTQTHQWIQMLEDRQKVQDSVISVMNLKINSLQQQVDSMSLINSVVPAKEKKAENPVPLNVNARRNFGVSDLLLFLIAALAVLLAVAVSVLVPFYFFRENHRLREEVRNIMIELQRIKSLPVTKDSLANQRENDPPEYEGSPRPPASVYNGTEFEPGKQASDEYMPRKEKELSTVEFITRLELCIIANQEDEFNHAVAEMVQAASSKETTTLLRFLHRIAACVFRGRMPAQAPVMAEIKQFLWSCDTPVYYQTEKIVSWARSSTRLSDAQRAYIFSISTELDRMLAEHNRQFNT